MTLLRNAFASDDDGRRALRAIGGLLLATGFMVAAFRKSGDLGDPWGAGLQFLVVAIPCVLLLALGFAARRAGDQPHPWQTIYVVFGLILLPVALSLLVDWVAEDGDSGNNLNLVWMFLLTGAAGVAAALLARVRYGLLIAGISFLVAWLALWDEVLSDGLTDLGTLRGLLIVAALILAAGAALIATRRREEGLLGPAELVTAAGLAALVGTIGLSASETLSGSIFLAVPVAEATFLWDLAGLVVAVGMIGIGARLGARGPVYVGAVALLLFMVVVGLDLDDSSPDDAIVGWPLALAVLGAAGIVASLLPGVRPGSLGLDRLPRGGRTSVGDAPPPPAGPAPPPAP
jgi:hypothetical protein